jgi:hypothetical protein
MRASEKLSARNEAFTMLAGIDVELRATFELDPSLRSAGAARKLLAQRAKWADQIVELSGQPGPAPTSIVQAEAV